jgi:hypothetical protein
MSSTLKIGLALALFVVVIFGVTMIATNTPSSTSQTGGTEGGNEDEAPAGPALSFATTGVRYDPTSDDLTSRYFPGYFEMSDVHVPVSYWFQNPHKVPVKVNALSRSCTACSAARVAVFPHDAMKDFQLRAAASLPFGAAGPPNLLLPLAMTELLQKAQWKDLEFEKAEVTAEVPPRADDGSPTWGIFQVGVQVRNTGPQQKDVVAGLTPGKGMQQKLRFDIMLTGVTPFVLYPTTIGLGEFPEGAAPRTVTVFYWSASRGPEELPEPKLAGFDPNDPFVEVGKPIPLSPSEVAIFAQMINTGGKRYRVTAAYRFLVTFYRSRPDRTNGPTEPDIGPLTRDLDVAGAGHSEKLPILARITGLVGLTENREKIDLGTFTGSQGTEKSVLLATQGQERPDLALEVAPDLTSPTYLKPSLTPAPQQGQRRFWTLTLTVPPNAAAGGDLPPDSFVVLRAKTQEGTRLVRIPVVGRGLAR